MNALNKLNKNKTILFMTISNRRKYSETFNKKGKTYTLKTIKRKKF